MTATNGACACGFVSVRVCVWVIVGSYSSSSQEQQQSQEQRCHSAFIALFIFAKLSAAAAAVCLDHTGSFWRCGSHGTTVAVLQCFLVLHGVRFVTATSGAPDCVCVRIMWVCRLCARSSRTLFRPQARGDGTRMPSVLGERRTSCRLSSLVGQDQTQAHSNSGTSIPVYELPARARSTPNDGSHPPHRPSPMPTREFPAERRASVGLCVTASVCVCSS